MANNKKTSKSTSVTTTEVKKSKPANSDGLGFVKISNSMPNAIGQEYVPGEFTEAYNPGTYNSMYQDQIDAARNNVINFNYDPLKDANYQALAKVYGQRGNIAAKNSMADAAALNGGYGTSFGVAAAQQARNQYNQELAALIPELEQTAYSRAANALSVLNDADNTAYSRYRDTEGDQLNRLNFELQKFNTNEGNRQFAYNSRLQEINNAIANWQWAKNYNLDYDNHLYSTGQKTAKLSGGGGGGGGGGYSGGGYTGSYAGGGGGGKKDDPAIDYIKATAKNMGDALAGGIKNAMGNITGSNKNKGANLVSYQPTPISTNAIKSIDDVTNWKKAKK